MFVYSKKWSAALTVGTTTILGLFLYLIYGFAFNPTVFLNLWKLQLARYYMSFDSLFVLLRDPLVADRALVDGWIYFGWAAMLLLLVKDLKKNLPVILGFLSYFAVFVFAIPAEPLHGWYRYPFYPFLAIAIALFLKEYFNKNYLVSAAFFTITGLSMFAESWGRVFGFSYPVLRTYLAGVAFGAVPGIAPKLERRKIFQWVNIAILCVIILLSVWTIVIYNEQ